jgi:serine/threonine-protein kinase
MAPLPESIGDYKVERELGRGAMGVVYLATHPTLGRQVAIKVMGRELSSDPEFLERFRREGMMAASLRHPNIVAVYDFAHRDGLYFIVMEYLGAKTLKDLIEEGRQPLERSGRILDQLLSALALAHGKNIVHRDIKPANIMLTDSGSIALTDFSVAHMKECSKLTQTGAIIGTPEYMSPEQFDGQWDGRSDLYAAGIVFYELLTGFSPFRSNTMTEVMRKQLLQVPDPLSTVDYTIPESLSQVVSRALEKDPALRYQSAEEMRQALLAALKGDTPLSAEPSPEPALAVTSELFGTTTEDPQAVEGTASRRNLLGVRGLRILAAGLLVLGLWWGLNRSVPKTPTSSTSPSSPSAPASPSASASPSAPASPSASSTPTPATSLPEIAIVLPGQAVGQIALGASAEVVGKVWGKADHIDAMENRKLWIYGLEAAEATLFFSNSSGKLEMLSVFTSRFPVGSATGPGVGTPRDVIVSFFGQPTAGSHDVLLYDELGVIFTFAAAMEGEGPEARRCDSVTIFEPGQYQ